MDKYGVDTVSPEAKTAAEKVTPACPRCGETLAPLLTSNVPRCPRCGTEPFEAAP